MNWLLIFSFVCIVLSVGLIVYGYFERKKIQELDKAIKEQWNKVYQLNKGIDVWEKAIEKVIENIKENNGKH